MKHSRLSPARIARSLVTVVALSIVQVITVPVLSNSAIAYTQGTATNGTAYGGTGGSPTATNLNCTNGAVVAIGATKSGNNLNTFMFVCKTINSDASLSATDVTTNVMGAPSESDRCATGQIGIGIRAIASNGGTLIGGVGLICGNPMSQGNQDVRAIKPNALSAGTVYTYTCAAGQLLAGFYLRTGSLVDQITPKCSTFSGFSFAAVGAPTATVTGNTASVSFATVSGNIADTALTYTVSAVPNTGPTITVTGSGSPIAVPGLVLRSNYTVTVSASNAYGSSAATSSTSAAVALPGSDTDTALYFDGTDYVKVADSNEVDFTNAFTFQAWVKPETMTSYGMILNKEDSIEFYISGGYYGIAAQKALNQWGYFQTGVPAVVGEWHHIAYTRAANSTTVSVYLDGYLAWSGVIDVDFTGAPLNTSYPLMIGGRSGSGSGVTYDPSFKGMIDHIAVYSAVRTQSQIQSDMKSYISPSATDLLLYYDFNEGTGTTLYNRKTGSTAASDLLFSSTSPVWTDVKEVATPAESPYTIVKFPRSYITVNGGWKVPSNVTKASVLVVGGGGGGGGQFTGATSENAGGGGGGGVISVGVYPLAPGNVVTVSVGAGGLGGKPADDRVSFGMRGGTSAFDTTLTAGGGGGATYTSNDQMNGGAGVASGSGGGSTGYWNAYRQGIAGTASSVVINGVTYSRTGGSGAIWNGSASGAGGGAGGSAGSTSVGAGVTSSFSGESIEYGRGGTSAAVTMPAYVSKAINPGNGGDGYRYSNQNGGYGVSGATGIIIVRWITALVPTYTKPSNAYLNLGMTETFTTNVAQDSATVVLTRTFKWESTTPAANGVYTLIKQGTGAANASFSWVPTDTSTSGSGYLYRLTVTDSDTAGLFITDSSTAYALINRALVVSGNSTFGKTINVARSETFTITLGTSTYRPTLSPVITGITLDTSTAGLAVVKISETMTVGTYFETLTVIDSVSASVSIPLTIKVVAPPTFSQSDAVVEPGLIYHLDPGNSASYARTGNSISDLSGRGRSGSLGFAFGNSSTAYTYKDGSTRNNAWQADVTCSAPTFSNTPVGNFSYSNGVCSYVPNIETVTTYTYDIWFKSSGSQTAWTPIVTTPYYNTNDQIMFSLDWMGSNTLAAGLFNGSTWYHTTTGTISSGVWIHATVTFNGTTLSLILNGDVAGKKTTSITAFTWNAAKIVPAIQFAKKWDGAQYFNGSIGSFRLYNRVLTTAEIEQNYFASSENYSGTINTPSKSAKYGSRYTDTYTAFSQANSATTTLASSVNGLRWDTSTSLNAAFLYQDTLTVGTYYDTITVSDNFGGSSFLPIALTVAKADTLTISMDTATAVNFNKSPITLYPKPTYRGLVGSDTLTVTTKFSSLIYALSSTVPTNADTYTVIASDPVFTFGAASNYQAIVYETSTAVVNKISQRALGIYMYGGVVGSPFLISLTGGDGDGVVTETLTGISNVPGCAISNHYLTSTTSIQGFCEVQVVKAASQNYFSESQTVQLYFMAYVNFQPNGQVGSGSTIAINGSTSLTIDDTNTVRAPNVTSLSVLSGSVGTTIHIYGGNFGAGPLTIKFYRNKIATGTVASGSDITVTVPSGATTGPILVIAANGEATTPTFTVLP